MSRWLPASLLLAACAALPPSPAPAPSPAEGPEPFEFRDGDRLCIVGNTFAERMALYGRFEARLQCAYPEKRLVVRNLGWSADEVGLQPRPLNFGSQDDHLRAQKASVVVMCFGLNEAYGDLATFERDYDAMVERTRAQKYDGVAPPRVILVSPLSHEFIGGDLPDRAFVDGHNAKLKRATEAIARVAGKHGAAFVDLFAREHPSRLTFNGIHLEDEGYAVACDWICDALGVPEADGGPVRELVIEKDEQFSYRYRAVNGEYIYGRRREPFGTTSFPPEMKKLDENVAELDGRIWEAAGRP